MSGRRKPLGGKNDPLNKRIPENPRYKHIKPVVDSGASVTKYLEHLEEMQRNYKFKKDEIFRRIKVSTFAQLVLQVASVSMEEEEEEEGHTPLPTLESPLYTPSPPPSLPPYPSPPSSARSTLLDLVSGVGEMDISQTSTSPSHTLTPSPTHSSPEKTSTDCPYLLLDVRDPEDYKKCHIITAKNYPAHMLSRSCNPFTREMLHYKTKPNCIIILCDENESIAPEVATKIVQRGFDNIFMLSGGMKVLYRTFPNGFLTGVVPLSCFPSPPASVSGRKKSSSQYLKEEHGLHTVGGVLKESFTHEDLLSIQRKLDDVLLNSSSSRASSRSSLSSSRLSSVTRTSRTDTPSIKPWK